MVDELTVNGVRRAARELGHGIVLRTVERSPYGRSHTRGTCACGATLEVIVLSNGWVSARGSALKMECAHERA